MSATARLAMGDDTLYLQKGKELFKWEADGTSEGALSQVPTPHGVEDWLDTARANWRLARVIDEDENFDPEVDPPFPKITFRKLDTGEQVAVIAAPVT